MMLSNTSTMSLPGKKLPPILMSSTPNVPGMRRDISTAHPGLVRQYRHFQNTNTQANETNLTSWSQEDSLFNRSSRVLSRPMSCGSIRDEEVFSRTGSSLNDSYKNLSTMSLRMQSFPAQADSFCDTSGRYSLRSQQQDRSFNCRALPYSNLDSVPHFVTKEREQLCRVKAYFLEKIPHNDREQDRARVAEVIFYIEDNTIEIIEPFIPNCGIRHGRLLHRCQVPKPQHCNVRAAERNPSGLKPQLDSDAAIYTIRDVYAGAKLMIYKREFIIMDCDARTKRYLEDADSPFGDPLPLPHTLYDPRVSKRSSTVSPKTNKPSTAKTSVFFEFDQNILQFYGIWDMTEREHGDALRVRLHYHLSDGTIEGPCEGRDRVPKYLKKATVYTSPEDTTHDGPYTAQAILHNPESDPETLGQDSMTPPSSRPYHWTDLYIGKTVKIIAFNITLTDADTFTRHFYNLKNMPLCDALSLPSIMDDKKAVVVPPHDESGAEDDDAIHSCFSYSHPKNLKRHDAKLKGILLRFYCTLTDEKRIFLMTIYLEDDSVSISEPKVKNSGYPGGLFLSRTSLRKSTYTSFTMKDLCVGGVIKIFCNEFKINDADKFTIKYLAENSEV